MKLSTINEQYIQAAGSGNIELLKKSLAAGADAHGLAFRRFKKNQKNLNWKVANTIENVLWYDTDKK